jgi:hypothetical protein
VASLEFEGCSEEADGSGEVVTAITLPWRKNVVKTKQKKTQSGSVLSSKREAELFHSQNLKQSHFILSISDS